MHRLSDNMDSINQKLAEASNECEIPTTDFNDKKHGRLIHEGVSSTLDEIVNKVGMCPDLRAGYTQSQPGKIKAPSGQIYRDLYFDLTDKERAALKNTPLGKMMSCSALHVDCAQIRPPTWLVDGLIHEAIIAMIAGAGAVG